MQKSMILSLFVALVSGLAIGVQAALNNAASRMTGPVLTGLLVNFMGGAASAVILTIIFLRQGSGFFADVRGTAVVLLIISGVMGVGIVIGVAYALPRIGLAAGIAAIIAGQMIVAVLVDAFALAGGQAIPLDVRRIGGLILLGLGTWALFYKGN